MFPDLVQSIQDGQLEEAQAEITMLARDVQRAATYLAE